MKLRRQRKRGGEKGALELIEEAVHLIRLSGGSFLVSYYTGSIPFVVGLLYFCSTMSRGAYGHSYIASASFGMALLYTWMKFWQAVCCNQIMGCLSGSSASALTVSKAARVSLVQTVIQSSALLVLPAVLLMVIPFGWVYAFYFNVSVVGNGDEESPQKVIRQAARQAVLWPLQNHVVISVLMLFGFFVFLNVGIALYIFPQLLKNILGIETVFTKSGLSLFNSTFFATVCSLCYLIMNPLIRTVYTLRCFYGNSIRSGADLSGQLSTAFGHGIIAMTVMVVLLFSPSTAFTRSQPDKNVISQLEEGLAVSPAELNSQISKVLNKPEYVWRQKEKIEEEKKGIIEEFFNGIIDFIDNSIGTLYDWIEKFFEWIDDFLPEPKGYDKKTNADGTRSYLLYTLIFVGVVVGIYFLWNLLRSKNAVTAQDHPVAEMEQTPELTEQYVSADQLTTDKWIAMSKDLAARGEFRLALRAVYLATLAMLSQNSMITITRFKSNRDYEKELARKVRETQPLLSLFSQQVAAFNQSWYGMSPVTNEILEQVIENYERIAANAVQ